VSRPVFQASTRGGRYSITLEQGGDWNGQPCLDSTEHTRGQVTGKGRNTVEAWRKRMPALLADRARIDGTRYLVAVDTLGLAADGAQ
tara:strand:+ start:68 stop:328 length:261 start_codon:yes stop_codon:yes gene_type:complete